MKDSVPERAVILLPLGGAPKILAAERSLYDQACRQCGHVQNVSQIPVPDWASDKFRIAFATPALVGSERNLNALATRVFGSAIHGPVLVCRRPAKDEDMYGLQHSSDRYLQPFDAETAREVLAALKEV